MIYNRGQVKTHLNPHELVQLAKEVLSQGNGFRFCAYGNSMMPFLKDGDIITLKPNRQNKRQVGEVVAFLQPKNNTLAVHRVLKVMDNCCILKGDNNENIDGEIPNSAIIGIVTRIDRKGQAVYFGFGLERFVIALLSQLGWLQKISNLLGANQ
ncbi:MAG: signal peptidase I [Hyphomonadaceae bacterium]|nr:signal peptidase I [Clostridia bacterium]